MTAVVLFLKYPEPGKVKSRLARELGPKRATEVYEALLRHTFGEIAKLDPKKFAPVAYCDPFRPIEDYQAYLKGFAGSFEAQSGADLGERLAAAASRELARHEKVLIIGTDCPGLQASHIERAARSIGRRDSDVILGPTMDGGYYLIGLKRFHAKLFQDIPWSTERVCELTEKKARAARLKVKRLEELRDIDTQEDLSSWGGL